MLTVGYGPSVLPADLGDLRAVMRQQLKKSPKASLSLWTALEMCLDVQKGGKCEQLYPSLKDS